MQNENGVLAVQEDFGNTLVDKYAPVWDKKYGKHLRGPDWRCHGGRHSHR